MEIKGFTYGYGSRKGDLASAEAIRSQNLLYETGVNWVCLAVAVAQKTFYSTEITFDFKRTPKDKEITETIKRAKCLGKKVCLKPILNCMDGMWRAYINFPDADMMGNDRYWDEWFESYTAFLLHYAQIAQDTQCEMFCVGCEMSGTERKEAKWREVIKSVREVYTGKLTYNTNHGNESRINWFDTVDYIGTSAYYPVASVPGASKEEMINNWKKIAPKIEEVSRRFNKPVIFVEIGCRSAKGCAMMPWDFTHKEFPYDEDEQANFYDSCMEVFSEKEWFSGFFWWDWSTKIYETKEEAQNNTGFNIHLKKAEEVIKKWYRKPE
ncbi:MAG: glycosyl hydrolase family 53 [Clostridiales bacterium]|jgi:hypothetical protein|nr:glycosyl hydrolase family 53 [Clostridiales bacterium]